MLLYCPNWISPYNFSQLSYLLPQLFASVFPILSPPLKLCPYRLPPLHFCPSKSIIPNSPFLYSDHLISLSLPLWLPLNKAKNSLTPRLIPILPLPAFLSPCCPISNPSLCLPCFSSLFLPLSSFPSQRLIHSRMALFPPRPSDNIKIQNGQLNPSSISDLIVMVLPPVPGRPLPPRQPGLYDTKWPGYNFSIYSKKFC